ncbi:VWA domain-containing protein [Granulosicoccus sp.]|nr:VWA domain-containing protein [Granulosicoccus sp.]
MDLLTHLHFIRPLWLLAIPLCALLLYWHVRHAANGGWTRYIAADKLPFLALHNEHGKPIRYWLPLIPLALACIALAGPSWQQLPGNVASNRQAMVILLDLSPSMLAKDLNPDRLQLARLKLIDLLRTRIDGETALIAYAGDAHRVTPLTDDPAIIENLVPILHPDIMPLAGSETEQAVDLALALFAGADLPQGDIVLLTDGINRQAAATIRNRLPEAFRLSILGIGSVAGAPIPDGESGFVRNAANELIMAALDEAQLQELATSTGGRYSSITVDNSDVDYLSGLARLPFNASIRDDVQRYDTDHDAGYWLILVLLPMAAWVFRRNLLWLALPLMVLPPESHAWDWQALWQHADQRGEQALKAGQPGKAADLFEDPKWVAIAHYRNGDYEQAVRAFTDASSSDDFYNLGNALALSGDMSAAQTAYAHALELDPLNNDASFNLNMIESLLAAEDEAASEQDEENSEGQGDGGDSPGDEQQATQEQQLASQGEQQQVGGAAGAGQTLDQQTLQTQGQSGNAGEQEIIPDDETVAQNGQDATAVQQRGAISSADEIDAGFDADSSATEFENNDNKVLNPYSEQWLRTLPQDPGGYLRRQFQYQAQRRHKESDSEPSWIERGRY